MIHPREITDKAQYAIDQFVMRGGKLIAFLDPLPLMDTREQNQMLGNIPNSGSNLDKLLKAWGLVLRHRQGGRGPEFQDAGRRPQRPAPGSSRRAFPHPGGHQQGRHCHQPDRQLWLPFAGAFTGTPVDGLKETVLLKSTKDSQLVDGFMANLSGENIIKEFKPSGTDTPWRSG